MSTESDSPPPQNPTPSPVTSKRPQPVTWAHQETVHLIQVYQDRWYASKRGPLKAHQWDDVALHVALLCGGGHPAKSALQCRHKMEKLRKRFREEKRRLLSSSSASSSSFWPYYYLMDALERGSPLAPPLGVNYHYATPSGGYLFDQEEEEGEDDEDEDEEEVVAMEDRYYDGFRAKSRSVNYIIREPVAVGGGESSGGGGGKRKREEERGGGVGLTGLAAEIRGVAERIVGVEREKLEMVKEMERWKMDMENKRMEMILGSQRKLVRLITDVFGEQHKIKVEDGRSI